MAQKWYQKATVQAALVGGSFVIAAALITGIFNLWQSTTDAPTRRSSETEDTMLVGERVFDLPEIGSKVGPSRHGKPLTLLGLKLDKGDPFHIDFIFSPGDTELDSERFPSQALKLIEYFLTALTLPEDQMWVNLSPFEEDRIITQEFSATQMGRDFLRQDYLLKQLAATLTDPKDETGQRYWAAIYAKVREKYGAADAEVNSYNKVWIVPDQASVALTGNNVLVTNSRLRVLTDYDYVASHKQNPGGQDTQLGVKESDLARISSEVTKSVLLPEIEAEVNFGVNFGPVRQAYSALILATWYKRKVRASLLNDFAQDNMKLTGLVEPDSAFVEDLYTQYLRSFNVGVFNYVREDLAPDTLDVVPRKYFSGGITTSGIREGLKYRGKLELTSLAAAAILVHATLFAPIGSDANASESQFDARGATSLTQSTDDPGGIDFSIELPIDEDGLFEFEAGPADLAFDTTSFAPRIHYTIAYSSLFALVDKDVH